MKILLIHSPYQDDNTIISGSPIFNQEKEHTSFQEIMNGDMINIKHIIPTWTCITETIREKDGGFKQFMKNKETFTKEHNLEGIYLYDIQALSQIIVSDTNPNQDPEIIYYIRFAYIKPKI
jgi:hypothetical protein